MMQDRYIKDGHKIINGTKELKGNIVKAMVSHVDELHYQQDITLISSLFSKEYLEEGKFVSLTLSEISKQTKDIKESFMKKKQHTQDLWNSLHTIEKLIYLVCIHEA